MADKKMYVVGYAATWIREPDAAGDVCKEGCFKKSIEKIKREGLVLPFLFSHKSSDIYSYIGTVTYLAEDRHGLLFEAVLDDTPEAIRAGELLKSKRIAGFSFAYNVLEKGTVKLPDGRTANELRELDLKEISVTLYPANRDTSVVSIGEKNVIDHLLKQASALLFKDVKRTYRLYKEADALLIDARIMDQLK